MVANGVRLHVQRLGGTPAPGLGPVGPGGAVCGPVHRGPQPPFVVFIHGLFVDNMSSLYYSLANPVAAAGCEVLLYDLRGHGRSERTPDGYTMDDSVADLVGLLDTLGVDRPVHVVGHSFGASIALRTGLQHPERVASLVLIEPHIAGSEDGGSWVDDVADTLTATALSFEQVSVPGDLPGAARRRMRTFQATNDFLNATTLIEDVAAAPPFTEEELSHLVCPTLVVYGEHTDLASSVRALAMHAPACEINVFGGLGHAVLRDACRQVLDLLVPWLERPREPRADEIERAG
ncbi:MAG TPA: alpha/beta hydrolase [Actinomycetota bacterium]|nr:alpha/beta hydrolase [Actinomycetota bacterium]